MNFNVQHLFDMAYKGKFSFKIGRAGRARLKKTSPFATLLLDLSANLGPEAVGNFKLALQVDKICTIQELSKVHHASDIFCVLEKKDFISSTDMTFIEDILIKIGRKDLEQKIVNYHKKREKRHETQVKQIELSVDKHQAVDLFSWKRSLPEGESSVDASELGSSQYSQMSVCDDEKIEFQEKMASLEIDADVIMASQ